MSDTAATESPPFEGSMFLYEQPVLLNKEEHGGGWWKPSNLCYKEKWRYLKQESVSKRNVFCWGVRNNKFRNKPRPDTGWQRAVKKMGEAGWFAPLGIRGIHARYARSDADKILNVGYYFFLTTRMSWLETRDWMRDLKPRIQAGFQGKFLTPHRKPTTSPEPQPPHTARRAISPAVGTSGQENESLIAKARTMQGRLLTGREVQELFTGNTTERCSDAGPRSDTPERDREPSFSSESS